MSDSRCSMSDFARRLASWGLFVVVGLGYIATPRAAYAGGENVGLGVAAGVAYSPTHVLKNNLFEPVGNSFSWGFFVDIPLTETFYITPAAMLYQLDLGLGAKPVTDIDLNFKFMVPLGPIRLSPGITVGLTSAEQKDFLHLGALAYVGLNLVSNVDAFILAQYKRVFRGEKNLDDLHGYGGLMFRF